MVLLRHRNESDDRPPATGTIGTSIGMADLMVRALRHSDYPDGGVAPTIILSAGEKAHLATRRDHPNALRGGR
jgi:hypothetical protein